jgi:predicted nucleic acid-binding protein
MKVLIDTNLVLDLLLNRAPFVANAVKVFEQAEKGCIEAYLTANSVTDIVYILRKAYSNDLIREHLQNMFGFIKIMSVTASDIFGAFKFDIPDFEDALLMQCAKAGHIDYIVTRNKKDFQDCPVGCLSLEEWVEQFC